MRPVMFVVMRLFAVFVWLSAVLAMGASARGLDLAQPGSELSLTRDMLVLIEPGTHSMTAATALRATGWQVATAPRRTSVFKPATLWLRTPVHNNSDSPVTRWISVRPWRLAQAELFEVSGTSLDRHTLFEAHLPVKDRTLQTVNPVFELTLAPHSTRELLLRIQDHTIPTVSVQAWWPSDFKNWQTRELLLEAALLAVALAVFVMLTIQLDARLLMLGLGLAASVLGELFYEGHLPAYFITGVTQHYSLVFPFFAAISFGMMGQIGLTFVGQGKPRFWHWLFGGLFVLLLLSAMTGFWRADRLLSRVLVGYLCLTMTLVYPLFLVWKPRHSPVRSSLIWWLFLLAWLLVAVRTASTVNVIPSSSVPMIANLSLAGTLTVYIAISISYAMDKRRQQKRLELQVQSQALEYRHKLEREVQERTQELSTAKRAAEEANAAKSRFLGRVTHDLRSPLTSILGYSQMLMRAGGSAAESAKIVHQSGKHMLGLVNDLIDAADGHTDEQLKPRAVYIQSLINTLVKEAQMLAQRHGNTLLCEMRSDIPPVVMADARRLRQVLLNVLDNAAKYTKNGHIQLTASASALPGQEAMTRLCFEVSDSGCGIPANFQPSVFQPFARANPAAAQEGLGLGLSIVQTWVERMQGKLQLSSQEGLGTTVRIELPLPLGSEADMSQEEMLEQTTELPRVDAQHRRIVLVEDNEAIRQMLKDWMEETGFQVESAATGAQFLALASDRNRPTPDLVITDYLLPEANGEDVLHMAKSIWPQVPVILLSATQRKTDQGDSGLAFDAALMKPVHLGELLQTMASVLGIAIQSPGDERAPASQSHPEMQPAKPLTPSALQTFSEMIRDGAVSDLLHYTGQFEPDQPRHKILLARIRMLAARGDLEGLTKLNPQLH